MNETVEPALRTPLFCDTALAGRIERVEAQLITVSNEAARRRTGSAGFVIPVAGGVASFAGGGSPYNKVAGLGLGGVPDASSVDETERVMPPGVEVRLSPEDEAEVWLDAVAEGSVHPDTQGVPWHEEFSREAIIAAERDSAAAGDVRYAALRDGGIVGGATLRIAEGVAQLTGAATVPAHRRRGVQTALLSARLADAAAAGCDVAVIITQPGSKSQQNAQRQGFDLLYTRAVLIKQP